MSNDNNGSGLLGGLVLGAGFAGLLLAPFYKPVTQEGTE